jgi:NAD(P)-dependent dehydrogenase (short-subunit alcohol dehydrogenase family)
LPQHKQPFVALVNNAGIFHGGVAEGLPLEAFRNGQWSRTFDHCHSPRTVMEVNYFGLVATTKAYLPLIRASKGRVINVSSVAGLIGSPAFSTYCASKFALEGFSDSIRKELLPLGVSVSIVNPAYVKTPIFKKGDDDLAEMLNDAESMAVYGDAIRRFVKNTEKSVALADTTEVTDRAIVASVSSARPSARYFVANGLGTPAVVLAFLVRVLPTNLFDFIVLNL